MKANFPAWKMYRLMFWYIKKEFSLFYSRFLIRSADYEWIVVQITTHDSKKRFVISALTLMVLASGKEGLGGVQSICCGSMFDERTGIKSQECAGIQILCEYIISSIIPPYDCTSALAHQTVTGVVLLPRAPRCSPPSWSPQPACEGAPCLICQLSLL